ncbi:MAG: AAA family ATPase [Desulfatiglandales bacterium]
MKILRLNIMAFGPFAGADLDLSGGDQGLHMIYGPNEAGKSSALRALCQVLYGIPERSPDSFLHPYSKMRIGAALRHSDGEVLEVVRRKGRINTLRSGDDKTLMDEGLLRRFLGNVDEDHFRTMFGIGHAELVMGGKEIVEGAGHIGRILFSAGSGIADVLQVQRQLQSEADLLFRPSASTRRINETLARYKENRRSLREAQLPGREWDRHDQMLREALERKASVDLALSQKERELHRLKRVEEALPAVARRKEVLEELEDCAHAVLLPPEFGEQRRELLTNLKIGETEKVRAQQGINALERELSSLDVPESILEQAVLIEKFHRDLGSHQKALKDRAQLENRKNILESDANEILAGLKKGLSLADADALRLEKGRTVRIRELGALYERLMERLENARKDIGRLTGYRDDLELRIAKIDAPRDVRELRRVLKKAEIHGALEEQFYSEYMDIQVARKRGETALGRQRLWSGTLEDLETLPLPSLETIDRFELRLSDARGEVERILRELRKQEKGLLEIEGRIEKLRLEQEVPTERDLLQARALRETGWRLVRQAWQEGEESSPQRDAFVRACHPGESLADAYEVSVRGADELADRLRREADRVAKQAGLLSERNTRMIERDGLQSGLDTARNDLSALEEEWSGLWETVQVTPTSPREMRAWTQNLMAVAEETSRMAKRSARAKALKERIEASLEELSKALKDLGEAPGEDETLSDCIARGRQVIEGHEDTETELKRLIHERAQRLRELQEARQRAEETEREIAAWRIQWAEAVQVLQLGEEASPAQADAVMEDLKSLLDKLKEVEILRKRIQGIDRDAEGFLNRVDQLAEGICADMKDRPLEQTIEEFYARLTRARELKTRQKGLKTLLLKEKETLSRAEEKVAQILSQLAAMCEEAGCSNYEELAGAEARSDRRRSMEREIKDLDGRLLKLSGGATIEKFVGEVLEVDPDGIDHRISLLKEDIAQLELEKSELDQAIGSQRTQLGKMDGGARAADLEEEGQNMLARLESDVAQYVRLQMASAVLSRAIERYREKHQDPILKRADEIFARLTLGSFEGLRVEYNDQGEAVLVGVRNGGKEIVGTSGMSDGTADQLYLALRLASLEDYLQKNEPLPFVVDDILIRFDNERAVAALQILEKLAAQTQVIFFTHHRHLVALAEASLEPSVLFKHALDRSSMHFTPWMKGAIQA